MHQHESRVGLSYGLGMMFYRENFENLQGERGEHFVLIGLLDDKLKPSSQVRAARVVWNNRLDGQNPISSLHLLSGEFTLRELGRYSRRLSLHETVKLLETGIKEELLVETGKEPSPEQVRKVLNEYTDFK